MVCSEHISSVSLLLAASHVLRFGVEPTQNSSGPLRPSNESRTTLVESTTIPVRLLMIKRGAPSSAVAPVAGSKPAPLTGLKVCSVTLIVFAADTKGVLCEISALVKPSALTIAKQSLKPVGSSAGLVFITCVSSGSSTSEPLWADILISGAYWGLAGLVMSQETTFMVFVSNLPVHRVSVTVSDASSQEASDGVPSTQKSSAAAPESVTGLAMTALRRPEMEI